MDAEKERAEKRTAADRKRMEELQAERKRAICQITPAVGMQLRADSERPCWNRGLRSRGRPVFTVPHVDSPAVPPRTEARGEANVL